jgi:hypothetical protein
MRSIREEIQTWLELVARTVNNIPFDKEVDWFDIEAVYNGEYSDAETPTYRAHNGEQLTYETVYCDAVALDHMCSEVLNGDFENAIIIIERYTGVTLFGDEYGFKKELRRDSNK